MSADYDKWKTYVPDLPTAWCGVCEDYEAIATIEIPDADEPETLRDVKVCHICIHKFTPTAADESSGGSKVGADPEPRSLGIAVGETTTALARGSGRGDFERSA